MKNNKVNTTVRIILDAGNYAVIPQFILRDQRLSANALRLLMCMINNEQGFKKQYTTYFGDVLGWCNDTVVKYSKELEALGYMKRVTTANPGKGKGFTHKYLFSISTVSGLTESVGTESVPTECNNNISNKSAKNKKPQKLTLGQELALLSFVHSKVETKTSSTTGDQPFNSVELNISSEALDLGNGDNVVVEGASLEYSGKIENQEPKICASEEEEKEVEKKEEGEALEQYLQLKTLNEQKIESIEQKTILFNYLKKLYSKQVDDIFDTEAAKEALREHFTSLNTQEFTQDNNVVKSWHSYLQAGVQIYVNKFHKREEERLKSKQRSFLITKDIEEQRQRVEENRSCRKTQERTTPVIQLVIEKPASNLTEEEEGLKMYTIEGEVKRPGLRYGA